MCRTYWSAREGNKFEFLGAFQDGHTVKKPDAPQAGAAVIDVIGVDPNGFNARLEGTAHMLEGLPTNIYQRLRARVAFQLTLGQLEGFLK